MRLATLLFAVLATAACSPSQTPALDAGADAAPADAVAPGSDAPLVLAVDFAVENCPTFDPVALTCTGMVPLALRFVPLATTTVTKYLWDFGDGSSEDPTPIHVYANPGTYNVRIIATGMGAGLVSKLHVGFVVAQPAPAAAPCDSDAQCGPNVACICGVSAPCAQGPSHGLCASRCSNGRCPTGQVCAGLLTAAAAGNGPEAWQDSLCLRACTVDDDCPTGLRCRSLPPDPLYGSAWVHGCFADDPRDVGEPCTDASGNQRSDLCASGLCADLGALGMCSSDCSRDSCPPGSDCAQLGDGRNLCLRSCLSFDCARDSLLACSAPGPGDLGYRLASSQSSNAGSSYCAPKSCVSDADCLPAGACANATGRGHCVRQ